MQCMKVHIMHYQLCLPVRRKQNKNITGDHILLSLALHAKLPPGAYILSFFSSNSIIKPASDNIKKAPVNSDSPGIWHLLPKSHIPMLGREALCVFLWSGKKKKRQSQILRALSIFKSQTFPQLQTSTGTSSSLNVPESCSFPTLCAQEGCRPTVP